MKMSPEMIDAAVIQLRSIFEHGEDIPDAVRSAAKPFLESLETWSEDLQKAKK